MALTKPPQSRKQRGVIASVIRLVVALVVVSILGALLWALSVAGGVEAAEVVDPVVAAPGRLVALDDLTIHLREEGGAGRPPILFLHDFDINGGRQWLALAPSLEGYRLIMPDMVDFGYSTRLEEIGRRHTVIGRAEAMAELLESLSIDRATVVGAGLGGAVAAQLAALRPEMVERLVLIGAEIYGPRPQWYERIHGWPVVGEAYNYTFYGASGVAARRYAAGCETGGWCPDPDARAEREVTARVIGTTAALNALGATPAATTLPGNLANITVPTLVIWGENDIITPRSQAQDLAAAIEGASVSLVPGAGHRVQLEDPQATAELIRQFLSA
jgi:3-oxoadipate enol-lactonase/3-oxoadipate enol-lactonase/4-carboxymuconolactone decarboxylase